MISTEKSKLFLKNLRSNASFNIVIYVPLSPEIFPDVKVILKKILKIFINKYFITILAFVAWMVFFDSNNILTRNRMQQKLDELNQEKEFYLEGIERDSTLLKQLMTDSTRLEKFAREKYLMKKDKEDLFLVIDTTVDQHR